MIEAISKQLEHMIKGSLSVYKNSFETIAGQLYSLGLQMVHEVMLAEEKQIHILDREKMALIARLLLQVFTLLGDSIITDASTQFIAGKNLKIVTLFI